MKEWYLDFADDSVADFRCITGQRVTLPADVVMEAAARAYLAKIELESLRSQQEQH